MPRVRIDAQLPYGTGVITGFSSETSSWGAYYSRDGTGIGGGPNTTRVYNGAARLAALLSYGTGVITAFEKNYHSWGIYYSADPTSSLTGAGAGSFRAYDGGVSPDFVIPFRGGVLVSFNTQVFFSPDGKNLAGGGNTQPFGNLTAVVNQVMSYSQGVITVTPKYPEHEWFRQCRIYFSPDGLSLTGGGNTVVVYDGQAEVTAITPYRGGVLTAFQWPRQASMWRHRGFRGGGVYFSPDGRNLGGGGSTVRVHDGEGIAMHLAVNSATGSPPSERVIAEFVGPYDTSHTRGRPWGIFSTPDATVSITGTPSTRVYSGSGYVRTLTPYRNGFITEFAGADTLFDPWSTYYSRDGSGLGGGPNTVVVYQQPT